MKEGVLLVVASSDATLSRLRSIKKYISMINHENRCKKINHHKQGDKRLISQAVRQKSTSTGLSLNARNFTIPQFDYIGLI